MDVDLDDLEPHESHGSHDHKSHSHGSHSHGSHDHNHDHDHKSHSHGSHSHGSHDHDHDDESHESPHCGTSCGDTACGPKPPKSKQVLIQSPNSNESPIKTLFKVEGMTCAGCADTLATHLSELPGVASHDISFVTSRLELTFYPSVLTEEQVVNHIRLLKFKVRT